MWKLKDAWICQANARSLAFAWQLEYKLLMKHKLIELKFRSVHTPVDRTRVLQSCLKFILHVYFLGSDKRDSSHQDEQLKQPECRRQACVTSWVVFIVLQFTSMVIPPVMLAIRS